MSVNSVEIRIIASGADQAARVLAGVAASGAQVGNVVANGAKQADVALNGLNGALKSVNSALAGAGVNTGIFGQAVGALTSPLGLVAIALGGMATAAFAGVRAMASNAEEVKKLVAVSGLSAEAADNLADTFQLLGKDSGTLTNALFKMGSEIDSGGKALKKFGVDIRDSGGALKTEGDLFLEVRDRISEMGSASERSAALTQLFGRAGRELADVMALSREEFRKVTEQAGSYSEWNEKLQRQAVEYQRGLAALTLQFDAIAQKIGAVVIPVLTEFLRFVSETIAKSKTPIDFAIRFTLGGTVADSVNTVKTWLRENIGRPIDEWAADMMAGTGLGNTLRKSLIEGFGAGTPGVDAITETSPKGSDRLDKEQLALLKANVEARLAIVQAGIQKEQALRGLAVAEGRMIEQDALRARLGDIEKQRAAEQAAFTAKLGLLREEGASESESATLRAAHTVKQLGLDAQSIQITTQLVAIREALVTTNLLTALANEEKMWKANADAVADYTAMFGASRAAITAAFVDLRKLEEAVGKTGETLALSNASWDLFKLGLHELDPAMLASVKRYVELKEGAAALKTSLDALIRNLTIEEQVLAATTAAQKPLTDMWESAGQKITVLFEEQQRLAKSTGLVGEAALRAGTAWELFGSKFDPTDLAMQGAVDRAVELKKSTDALSNQEALTRSLEEIGIRTQALGSDFDQFGAAVSASQRNFDAIVTAFQAGKASIEDVAAAGRKLRADLADQRLASDIEGMFLSITDTFTKMADGLIQGTLDIASAFKNLGQSLLVNFVQLVLHQVFDPVLKAAASFVTGLISMVFGGGGGGSFAGSALSIGGGLLGMLFGGGVGSLGSSTGGGAASAQLIGTGAGAGGGGFGFGDISNIGSVLSSLYSVAAYIAEWPSLLQLAANGLTTFGEALGIITPTVLQLAGPGVEGAAVVAELASTAGSAFASEALSTLLAGLSEFSGPLAILMLPLLAGALDAPDPEELWRTKERQRAAAGYTGDLLSRQSALAQGQIGIEEFNVRRDLGITGGLAETALSAVMAQVAQALSEDTATEFRMTQEQIDQIYGPLIQNYETFLAHLAEIGITPIHDITGMIDDKLTAAEEAIVADLRDQIIAEYNRILAALGLGEGPGASNTPVLGNFGLVVAQLNDLVKGLQLGPGLDIRREGDRSIIQYQDRIQDITDATADQLREIVAIYTGMIEDALLATPQKIVGLFSAEELTGRLRKGEETIEETMTRLGNAFMGLGLLMDSLDQQIAVLGGTLGTIPEQLAKNIGVIDEQMNELKARLSETTGDDAEALLQRAAALRDLIVARYQMEIDAVRTLTAQIEQWAALLGQAASAFAAASDMLSKLGVTIAGRTGASEQFMSNLPLSARSAAFGGFQQLGFAEARRATMDAYGRSDANDTRTPTARAIDAGFEALKPVLRVFEGMVSEIANLPDPAQRLAASSAALQQLQQGYDLAVAGIHEFYAFAASEATRAANDALAGIAAQRQAAQAAAESALQAIDAQRSAIQDASRTQIDAIRSAADEQVRSLEAQRDALQESLRTAQQWEGVAEGIAQTLLQLRTGSLAPPDAEAQFSAAQQAFQEALAASGSDPEAAARAAQLGQQLLQVALSTGLMTLPSPEYQALFQSVTGALEGVGANAAAQASEAEQMVSQLEALNAQIDQVRSAADAQVAAIESQTTAQLAALDSAEQAIRDGLAGQMAGFDAAERAINAELQATLAALSAEEQAKIEELQAALAPVAQKIADTMTEAAIAVAEQARIAQEQLDVITGDRDIQLFELELRKQEAADLAALHGQIEFALRAFVGDKLDAILAGLGFPPSSHTGTDYTRAGPYNVLQGQRILAPDVAEWSRRNGLLSPAPSGGVERTQGGGGAVININVDARGASDPEAVRRVVREAVKESMLDGVGGAIMREAMKR